MTPSETRIPPVVEVMSGDEDVLILERVTTTMVVCDACAERALRAVAADYERLRALKRNG